jgi:hypothetical protein
MPRWPGTARKAGPRGSIGFRLAAARTPRASSAARTTSSTKQKGIYSLTEHGIELLPILAQMAAWGYKYLPVTE